MNSDAQKTQAMTEFQVREAYRTLLPEHQRLEEAARRFTAFILAKDPALIESFFGSGAVAAAAALGIALPDKRDVPPPIKLTTRLVEGELHG